MDCENFKIIDAKFNEWTEQLDRKEKSIKVFEHIRDIPYALVPEFIDPTRGHLHLLIHNKGSCSPKHFLLGEMFQRLGIPVRYATYPFRWDMLDVNYPDELEKLSEQLPLDYHLACKAYIDGKWVLVDATWDLDLKTGGFPVNGSWDGLSDTQNGVLPLEEIIHETPDGRLKYVGVQESLHTEEEKTTSKIFSAEFNQWLEKLRAWGK